MQNATNLECEILKRIPAYTPPVKPNPPSYFSSPVREMRPCTKTLKCIKRLRIPYANGPTMQERVDADPRISHGIRAMCLAFQQEPDWPAYMSLVCRDKPAQGQIVTVLGNSDTLAAMLAIRMGIQTEVAVALSLDDLIYVTPLDSGQLTLTDYEDAVLLGTFARKGQHPSTKYALLARADAAQFSTQFRAQELILVRADGKSENSVSHAYNSRLLRKEWHHYKSKSIWVRLEQPR